MTTVFGYYQMAGPVSFLLGASLYGLLTFVYVFLCGSEINAFTMLVRINALFAAISLICYSKINR